MKHHLAEVKEKVEGDRPHPSSDNALLEILNDAANDLRDWFNQRYDTLLTAANDGSQEAEVEFYRQVQSDRIQAIALEIADKIDLSVPVPESRLIEIDLQDGDL